MSVPHQSGHPGGWRPDLTAQTAVGLRWSSLSSVGLVIANLAYTTTVSRLLDPAAFGLVALANLVVLFAQFFARMGLASALVQKPELSDEEVRAASTAGIAAGVVCFAVVWALTPAFSAVFRAPALTPVLRAMGVSFLIVGWSMTGLGLLRRDLRFRELLMIELGTYVLGFVVVGLGLAVLGAGVWSLVLGSLVSLVSQAVWQYALVRHPVRPVLDWQPYRALCRYGMTLSGAHLVDYVGSNLGIFAVGRFASTAVLGQYNRAFYLAFQPLSTYLAQALTSVLFSSLSLIQDDVARLRRAYLSVLRLGGLALFPICAGMAVAAPELVLVVLGPQWDLAAAILPWFVLAGGCNVVSKLSQSVAEARAELGRSLAVQGAYLVVLGVLLLAAWSARSRGFWVFAGAMAAGELLRHIGYLGLMRRILGLSRFQIWQSYEPAAFTGLGVGLAMATVRWGLSSTVPALVLLAVEIITGALILAMCIRFWPPPDVRRDLWSRLTAAGALGSAGGLRWRLAPLVLGPPDRTPAPGPVVTSEPRS